MDYLAKNKNYDHYSVRAFLLEEIAKRGMTDVRDSMVTVANDLRNKFGGAYIVKTLLEKARATGKDSIIESIRAVDEVNLLAKEGAHLFSVDADQKLRYERAHTRASETDNVTFEKFQADELVESVSTDPAKQNLIRCREMTRPELRLTNNGTFEDLYAQIEKALTFIN